MYLDLDPIGSGSGPGWLLFTSRTKDHRGHFNIVSQEIVLSNEGRIHLRRPFCHFHFPLAAKRRTIHAG